MQYNLEELYTTQKPEDLTLPFLGWLSLCAENKIQGYIRKLEQQKVLERFIRTSPKIRPVRSGEQETGNLPEQELSPPRVPEIVSETLAKIYLEQKKYNLALQTYGKLRLHNPEKSSYFAKLIREVEKEKQNT